MRSITVTPNKVRKLLESVGQITTQSAIRAGELSQEQLDAIAGLYPSFEVGVSVTVGTIRRFEGELYEVIQAHTTQADWTPPQVPALWKKATPPGVIPEWVQPTGAQDAYPIGAQVTHIGSTWESDIDANVFEPPEQWTQV